MRVPLIYVAGPFRGKTPFDVKTNVHEAEVLGLEIAHLGAYPIIPHAMTHHFDKQLTDDFWLAGTLELLRRCDALICSPRWEQSTGAIAERNEMERLGRRIFYRADQIGWRTTVATWVLDWARAQEPR